MKHVLFILLCFSLNYAYSSKKFIYKQISTPWYEVTLIDNWTKIWADNQTFDNVHQLIRHTPHDDGKTCITIQTHFNGDIEQIYNIKGKKDLDLENIPYLKYHIEYEIPNKEKKEKSYCEKWIFIKDKNIYVIYYYLYLGKKQYPLYKEVIDKAVTTFKIK